MAGDSRITPTMAQRSPRTPDAVLSLPICSTMLAEIDFFTRCCSGTIHVNPDVTSISVKAFAYCRELVEIKLPSGGLLREIGDRAFEGCYHLRKINMCAGLRTIGVYAFDGCSSLTHVAIPSTVTTIGDMAFQDCHGLKEVQLCEGLRHIGRRAFRNCSSLLHINVPSTVEQCGKYSFDGCTLLRNVAVLSSSNLHQENVDHLFKPISEILGCATVSRVLRSRFDDLPLHQMCFDHSIPKIGCNRMIGQLSAQCVRVDALGMTLLHVLACSGNHDIRLYRSICAFHADIMIAKDKWGDVPLAYIMLSEAPTEVLHYFLGMHKKKWGVMPFDFRMMIPRLAMYISGEYMRHIIQAQRTHFPYLQINWQDVVEQSFQKVPLRVFRVMLEVSISASRRRGIMSLEQQVVIDTLINFPTDSYKVDDKICFRFKRMKRLETIRRLITDFARLHKEKLLDATTILELALWKAMATDFLPQGHMDCTMKRRECRLHCGRICQVVIPNVVSYF